MCPEYLIVRTAPPSTKPNSSNDGKRDVSSVINLDFFNFKAFPNLLNSPFTTVVSLALD